MFSCWGETLFCLLDFCDVLEPQDFQLKDCAGWLQLHLLHLRARHQRLEGADCPRQHHQQCRTRQRKQALHSLPYRILDHVVLQLVTACIPIFCW